MSKLAPVIERALLKERADLVRQRDLALQSFDKQIKEIDDHLNAAEDTLFAVAATPLPRARDYIQFNVVQPTNAPSAEMSARTLNRLAVEACQSLLRDGKRMKAPELHQAMLARSIFLKADDPERRLIQLLSQHKEIFQSDRVNGWSLKSENPALTGFSSATMSTADEQ